MDGGGRRGWLRATLRLGETGLMNQIVANRPEFSGVLVT